MISFHKRHNMSNKLQLKYQLVTENSTTIQLRPNTNTIGRYIFFFYIVLSYPTFITLGFVWVCFLPDKFCSPAIVLGYHTFDSSPKHLQRKHDFFSSPKHKVLRVSYCDRPLSDVVFLVSSVNFFTSTSLLWNRSLDFDQTSQEWSLGGPLPKLLKPFQWVV